jgi:molybdopterin converting factor small subunit
MFDPDFLTTVGRARSGVSEVMSRFGVLDLFPGEKERYEDKAKFFAAVSDRANRYIKEITGAQMSEAEANRLLKAIPNVKDDPAGFVQKLNFVMEVSEAALDQYERIFAQSSSPEAARMAGNMVVNTMMDEYGGQDEELPEGATEIP